MAHDYLYEKITWLAKEQGSVSAAVVKGAVSFEKSSQVHRARLIEVSENLPVIIEIVDIAEKINALLPLLNDLMKQCGKSGLITIGKAEVIYYQSKK